MKHFHDALALQILAVPPCSPSNCHKLIQLLLNDYFAQFNLSCYNNYSYYSGPIRTKAKLLIIKAIEGQSRTPAGTGQPPPVYSHSLYYKAIKHSNESRTCYIWNKKLRIKLISRLCIPDLITIPRAASEAENKLLYIEHTISRQDWWDENSNAFRI